MTESTETYLTAAPGSATAGEPGTVLLPSATSPFKLHASARRHAGGLSRWGHVLLFSILITTALVPIWATEYFPSQNGPWFRLTAQMMKELDNPQWDYHEYYRLHWHPIPHSLNIFLTYGLSHVAPILTAHKLALSVYVVLLPLSIVYFLSVTAPDKKVLGYFAFLMIHTFAFYRGYHNFCLSIPLFFFCLGYWIRHHEGRIRRHWLAWSLLAVLVYFAHLFTFLLLACAIGWYRFVKTRSVRSALWSAVAVTWPGWLLLVDYVALNTQPGSWLDHSQCVWLPLHTCVENFTYKFLYSTSTAVYLLGATLLLWVPFLAARRIVEIGVAGREGVRRALTDPLLTMTLVLVVGYFVLPWKFLGWHYVNIRLIPFILGLALACVGSFPAWGRLRLRPLFLTTVCAGAIGIDVLMATEVARMDEHLQQYTSGVAAFERNKRLLPIHRESPRFGQIRPLTRAHEYYHIAKGGANGAGVAQFNTISPVWYRLDPHHAFPEFDPLAPTQTMRRIADVYDYVLVWGRDDHLATLLEQSAFGVVHENGKLRLYRRQEPAAQPVAAVREAPRQGLEHCDLLQSL